MITVYCDAGFRDRKSCKGNIAILGVEGGDVLARGHAIVTAHNSHECEVLAVCLGLSNMLVLHQKADDGRWMIANDSKSLIKQLQLGITRTSNPYVNHALERAWKLSAELRHKGRDVTFTYVSVEDAYMAQVDLWTKTKIPL